MKFGLFYMIPCADWQSPVQRYQDTLEQIDLGDELGFDNVWFAELHFDSRFSTTPSPLMVAAAAAQRTKKIRLGVAVNLLPLHNPVRIAEDIATLDVLSNGRAEFGVGRGAMPAHFQGFNIPIQENRDRFVEYLDFVIKAWTHEEFSFVGKYHSAQDLRIVPKPVQKPHPPIRIASNSADTFEMVGNLGHNMFISPFVVPMPALRDGVKVYRQTLAASGHPVSTMELSVNMPVFVAGEAEEARSVPEASVKNFLNALLSSYDTPAMQRAIAANPRVKETQARFKEMTLDDWRNDIAICGDPSQCVEKIKALQEDLQPSEIICFFNQGGLIEHPRVMNAMKLFASEVMPHFR